MKTDLEIAQEKTLLPIEEVASKLGVTKDQLECYGKTKAKLDYLSLLAQPGKTSSHLILVTSTNPTPFGEGKTTMSIGINDALCRLGKQSVVVLREPSLGPVFGIKGGATGGGYSQVVPMEEINLHFTGDMHALTAANNLLSAALDNHFYQGNELQLDPSHILFPRCMDMNDRSLRTIEISLEDPKATVRKDHFVITVASELMAILCLAKDLEDLKARIGNILIGYTVSKTPVYARDLKVEGAMTLLLKEAIKPNLVQTLEGNPAILHGGPFANIAHGCNSLIATKLGLHLADYVVTEAGFGADLGAEKFLDIKCQLGNLKPDVIVINTTIRSVKYNGGVLVESLPEEDLAAMEKGIVNLQTHIENMQKYSNHIIVCINRFISDTEREIDYVKAFCKQMGIICEVSNTHLQGGAGGEALAKQIVDLSLKESTFHPLYPLELGIKEKISLVAKEIYRANEVVYREEALTHLEQIIALGKETYPICIAKTQYSFSDDPKQLGSPKEFTMTVRDIKLSSGAGFVVVYMGNIMTMPGLSKAPSYLKMDITKDGKMSGLF